MTVNGLSVKSVDFTNSTFLRRTPPPKFVDPFHVSLLDPAVWIHSSLHDFMNITLFSWKIFWNSISQIF
jgi:hypothetical protein